MYVLICNTLTILSLPTLLTNGSLQTTYQGVILSEVTLSYTSLTGPIPVPSHKDPSLIQVSSPILLGTTFGPYLFVPVLYFSDHLVLFLESQNWIHGVLPHVQIFTPLVNNVTCSSYYYLRLCSHFFCHYFFSRLDSP